jgi:glycosyltransferase involved in cell wall biosynthesis
MRVLSVAFQGVPIGTPAAGGAEHVLSILEAALVKGGDQSAVIAAPGSRVAGELIESSSHKQTIDLLLRRPEFDLIHFHGLDFPQYLPETSVPMLATLHLPVSFYPEGIIENCLSRGIGLNCVSRNQAGSTAASRGLPVITNGIPTNVFDPDEPEDYLLWLGRICPEKGTHAALEVARRLDMRLIVAGPIYPYPEHRHYFSECVEPWLDNKRTWVGPVGLKEKQRLLARSSSLLVPSLVAETSSLVAMESLASGTPVVAFRQGALPEVIDDGETGFIVDSVEEMASAIEHVGTLSRARCRERAIARFDSQQMVRSYVTLYRRIMTRRFSSGQAPQENL